MMTQQQLEFASRIARIEAGTASSKATVFVGMDETFQYYRTKHQAKKRTSDDSAINLMHLLSLMAAFALGVASNVAWQMFMFHFRGAAETVASADSVLITDATAGIVMAMMLGHFLRLRSLGHGLWSTIGVVASIAALHNLVHVVPLVFASLFSTGWVSQIQENTIELSLIWRGVTYTL